MTYVDDIEPRLTPPRDAAPASAGQVLGEFTRDLEEELTARCARLSPDDLGWQPHPDQNSVSVTIWHVARWLDVLGTRLFTGSPFSAEVWHCDGWADRTGYHPEGLGFGGLGVLTGYTSEQMRAVPTFRADDLSAYLRASAARLVTQITAIGDGLTSGPRVGGLTPYQVIGSTLQGSFGHVGEVDALVSLRARVGA